MKEVRDLLQREEERLGKRDGGKVSKG